MTENINLIHERVDDIPLLIGLAKKLHLPEILDSHLGNHGHSQGLSNGWLATVWLAYILSEGDHRKSTVADWAMGHQQTLESLLEQPIRPVEFNDIDYRLSSSDWRKMTPGKALKTNSGKARLKFMNCKVTRFALTVQQPWVITLPMKMESCNTDIVKLTDRTYLS